MAEQIGKNIICDRCNETVFLKYIDSKHLDGGFTRVDNYEPKPAGWSYSSDLHMLLCPECATSLDKLYNVFKAYKEM